MHQLPPLYAWARLDAPELGERVRSKSAIDLATDAVTAVRAVLMGPVNAGKTSLAVAIGRAAMEARDVNGMFLDARAFETAHVDQRGRADRDFVMRAIDVPVLVVDEMGAEGDAAHAVAGIIHQRHAKHLQTVVSLALSIEAIREQYAGGIVKRMLTGAVRIRCDIEKQPKPSSMPVGRVHVRPPWTPPPPRIPPGGAPDLPVGDVAALVRHLAEAPIDADERELAERQARNREQASRLLAEEPKEADDEAAPA